MKLRDTLIQHGTRIEVRQWGRPGTYVILDPGAAVAAGVPEAVVVALINNSWAAGARPPHGRQYGWRVFGIGGRYVLGLDALTPQTIAGWPTNTVYLTFTRGR